MTIGGYNKNNHLEEDKIVQWVLVWNGDGGGSVGERVAFQS